MQRDSQGITSASRTRLGRSDVWAIRSPRTRVKKLELDDSLGSTETYRENMNFHDTQFSVWIVEDDRIVLEMVLETVNGTESFRCEGTFTDCAAALEALQGEPQPDVLLLDLRFSSGMKGIEAIDQIHTLAPMASIVVISAYYDDKTVQVVIECGVNGYLCKPVDPEQITNALKDIQQGIAHFSSPVVTFIQSALAKGKSTISHYGFTQQEKRLLRYISQGTHEKEMADTS